MLFAVQEFDVRLKSTLVCMEHFCHTVTGKRSACHGINLCRWVFNLLLYRKGNLLCVVAREEVLTLEQILPCLVVLDFGTQTSSLTLMIEIGSKDGFLISIDGDKTIDRTPEAITINRDNILSSPFTLQRNKASLPSLASLLFN